MEETKPSTRLCVSILQETIVEECNYKKIQILHEVDGRADRLGVRVGELGRHRDHRVATGLADGGDRRRAGQLQNTSACVHAAREDLVACCSCAGMRLLGCVISGEMKREGGWFLTRYWHVMSR